MMSTVVSTSNQPAASPSRRHRTESGGARTDPAFAALFSALRVGYGTGVLIARTGASAGEAFSPVLPGDARRCRVEQMTSAAREEARAASGRGAGLSDAPETKQLSGRAQRLCVEREATGDRRTGQVCTVTATRSGADGPGTAGPRHGDAETRNPRREDRAGGPVDRRESAPLNPVRGRAPGERGSGETHQAAGKSVKCTTFGEVRAEPAPPVSAPSARAAPTQRSGGPSRPPPTTARQIAQLLSAKLEGPDLARAGGGPATVRGDARTAGSATQNVMGKKAGAPAQARGQNEVARTVFEKLVRNIRMHIGTHRSTAKIRLHPPELGHVRVELKMVDARLEVRVHAENPAARELMSERLEILRTALQNHGLITERLELVDPRTDPQTSTAQDGGRSPDDRNEAPPSERRADDRGDGAGSRQDQAGPYAQAEGAEEEDSTLVTVLDARLDIHI